jgi:hypothetical protein
MNSVPEIICCRPKILHVEIYRFGLLSSLFCSNGLSNPMLTVSSVVGPDLDFAMTRRWLQSCRSDASDKSLWKQIIKDIPHKSRPQVPGPYELLLTQGHVAEKLKLRVHKYVPTAGDKQHYLWFDLFSHVEKEYRCPPYAIADVEYSSRAIEKFIDGNISEHVERLLLENGSATRDITRSVFFTALKVSKVWSYPQPSTDQYI